MSYVSVQREIEALVETVGNLDVHLGIIPDEEIVTIMDNQSQIRPYVGLSFGGFIDPRRGINGIAGARRDTYEASLVFKAVGSSYSTARNVWQALNDKLLGFVPTNCSELRPALYGGIGEISSLGSPTRYSSVQSYTFFVNSDFTG